MTPTQILCIYLLAAGYVFLCEAAKLGAKHAAWFVVSLTAILVGALLVCAALYWLILGATGRLG